MKAMEMNIPMANKASSGKCEVEFFDREEKALE